jgi:hypothetical protein
LVISIQRQDRALYRYTETPFTDVVSDQSR